MRSPYEAWFQALRHFPRLDFSGIANIKARSFILRNWHDPIFTIKVPDHPTTFLGLKTGNGGFHLFFDTDEDAIWFKLRHT